MLSVTELNVDKLSVVAPYFDQSSTSSNCFTNIRNKRVFVPGRLLQPHPMFVLRVFAQVDSDLISKD
jgi:hypothetical protein